MSLYSTSSSPSSSIRMLEPETMEERREVCELLPELLNSDMGEMHVERPGRKKSLVGKLSGEESQPDMEDIPLSI